MKLGYTWQPSKCASLCSFCVLCGKFENTLRIIRGNEDGEKLEYGHVLKLKFETKQRRSVRYFLNCVYRWFSAISPLCIENLENLKLVGVCKNQGLSEAMGVVKNKNLRMI